MPGENNAAERSLNRYLSSLYNEEPTAAASATGVNKRARYNRPAAPNPPRPKGPGMANQSGGSAQKAPSSSYRTARSNGPGSQSSARRGAAPKPPAPPAPPKTPNWWERAPVDVTELLRQLSVNAGQIGMPGGPSGAVVMPAFGSGAQAVMNPDMRTYGQVPGMGEATFFTQGMNGGMAPIAAMSPIGVPQNWNPVGANPPAKSGGSSARKN